MALLTHALATFETLTIAISVARRIQRALITQEESLSSPKEYLKYSEYD